MADIIRNEISKQSQQVKQSQAFDAVTASFSSEEMSGIYLSCELGLTKSRAKNIPVLGGKFKSMVLIECGGLTLLFCFHVHS